VSSLDQRRQETYRTWAATGCAEALRELDQLALREGREASITQAAMQEHLAKVFTVTVLGGDAVREVRGDTPWARVVDKAAYLILKTMTQYPAQEDWSVSMLMEVLGGYVSESTVRRALSYMVPDHAGENSVLVTTGERPVFYALREVEPTEHGFGEAAKLAQSFRAYGLQVRRQGIPKGFAHYLWPARRLRRSIKALRLLREPAQVAPLGDPLNHCAVC
jgi:hypothetical protein